jgi:hemoglobin
MNVRRNISLSALFASIAVLTFVLVLPPAAVAKEKSLYQRLGGYDAISAVVDDFAAKLFADPVVGKRFFGMGDDTRASFRQKNKNLVCIATGGPCKVISRPAKVVHGGLGIKASEFDIVVNHLVDTLNTFKVPEKEQNELLTIIGSLRPDIVRPDIVEVEDK